MGEKFLELINVSFKYWDGPPVLNRVSYAIQKGELVGLLGPNGAGKSTLLKLMLGRLQPNGGQVLYNGQDAQALRRSGKIGYLSQEARNFNPQFPGTVGEVVRAQLVNSGKRGKQRKKSSVENSLDLVGLKHRIKDPIGKLSGGQQQRVLLARTLVTSPDLIVLDEPLTGIDIESQKIIWKVLLHLNQELNKTIIIVSHNITSVLEYAAKILFVSQGNVTLYHDVETAGQMLSASKGLGTDIVLPG